MGITTWLHIELLRYLCSGFAESFGVGFVVYFYDELFMLHECYYTDDAVSQCISFSLGHSTF